MIDEATLKSRHALINDAWQFLKRHAASDDEQAVNDEFLDLYRKHDGGRDDFAHKILDAVLGEVQAQHERG